MKGARRQDLDVIQLPWWSKDLLGYKGNSLSPGPLSLRLLQDTHERHLLLSRVLLGVSHS